VNTPDPKIGKIGKIVSMPLATGLDAMAVVNQIVGAVNEWVRVHETETTKRELIRAKENVVVTEIQARRELFLTYLDRSFDERERAFNELFRALDRAMASDPTAVAGILGSITALASKNPFADLVDIDLVKTNLANPDHEWAV
jgi:hypothetical protein